EGAGEVVRADEEDGAGCAEGGAKLGQLGPGGLLGRFDFKIDNVAAGFGGFEEDFQLGVQRPGKVAAQGLAAAGGDGCHVAAAVEQGSEIVESGGGFRQKIEAELN